MSGRWIRAASRRRADEADERRRIDAEDDEEDGQRFEHEVCGQREATEAAVAAAAIGCRRRGLPPHSRPRCPGRARRATYMATRSS
jgi:hypothetical protein